jgi:hypothetical protein
LFFFLQTNFKLVQLNNKQQRQKDIHCPTPFHSSFTMKIFNNALILCIAITGTSAFAPNVARTKSPTSLVLGETSSSISRQEFISTAIATSAGVASTALLPTEPVEARGRATLEYSQDRYYPRLIAGGKFYANDLKRALEKNDWAAIKVRVVHQCELNQLFS